MTTFSIFKTEDGQNKILGMPPKTAFAVLPLVILIGAILTMWIIKK